MIGAILAFIPALTIGGLVVLLAWPGRYQDQLLLKLSMAAGLGPGIVACLYFGFSLFLRPRNRLYFGLEGAVLAALLIAVVLFARPKSHLRLAASQSPLTWISWLLIATLSGVVLIASASFAIQSLMQPHGIQDAWNIWNMRARFLFRGGPDWRVLFSPAIYWLNHPDYPFLVTAGTARAWNIVGRESTSVPILQAAIYSLGLALLIFSSLRQHRSTGQGAMAAILLVASPWFILFGAWQIADIPLVFFLTCALILLVINIAAPIPYPGLLFLGGLAGGLAAWTKNEGILFLVIWLFVWILARLNKKTGLRKLGKEAAWILAGLALPLLNLAYLKIFLAPSSDLFAGQTLATIGSRLLDLSRYTLTLSYLGKSIANFSQWSIPLFPILIILLILFWPFGSIKKAWPLLYPALAILLLGLGYFGIYLITPHDLVWHLRTSTDRLVFHLFPPLLWVVFMTTRTPEDVLHALASKPQEASTE